MLLEETVYLGRDNAIELRLTSDGVAITHTSITRVQLQIGATLLDSQAQPTFFDFTAADRLKLKLGSAGLAVGRKTATLIIYDALHANGLVWADLVLNVK